jgi:phospholipase C
MPASMLDAERAQNSPFASVQHIVQLMLENRSFDHLLGFRYTCTSASADREAPGRSAPESG